MKNEMSKSELDAVEKFADKALSPVDVEFTHHFLDRLTDPRNIKQISKAELISFFKRLARNKKKFIEFINNYREFVVKYDRYKLNIPFVRIGNQLVAKTIMRKKGFKTSNPKYKFEQFDQYLQESNVEKGKWVYPSISNRGEELVDLVQTAYKRTKDGSFVNSKGDLAPSNWVAMDFDDEPKLDVTLFYRTPRSGEQWKGKKIQGIGHDGSSDAKRIVLNKLSEMLKKRGIWIEASDAVEHILYKANTPYIKDKETIKRIFPDSKVEMTGFKGQYKRTLNSNKWITESVFGNPVI